MIPWKRSQTSITSSTVRLAKALFSVVWLFPRPFLECDRMLETTDLVLMESGWHCHGRTFAGKLNRDEVKYPR